MRGYEHVDNKFRPIHGEIRCSADFSRGGGISWAEPSDVLYIGSNNVKTFNANTGQYLGALGTSCDPYYPKTSGPCPAFGMFVRGGQLFVDNTNFNSPKSNPAGDVLRFTTNNGKQLQKLVLPEDQAGNFNVDAPYSPRGMVFWEGKVFVADLAELNPDDIRRPEDELADCGGFNGGDCKPGSIKVYNPGNGKLLKKLLPGSSFDKKNFHPRGLVIGPDGLLYVAVIFLPETDHAGGNFLLGGYVVRFNPKTGQYLGIFVDGDNCGGCDLNRPEGLVFGPDGNLYVASFRAGATDNDKILIFKGPKSRTPGKYIGKIDLAAPVASGGIRAYAQALLFGPDDRLYKPITGGDLTTTGEVRRYDVRHINDPYEVIIPSAAQGGQLDAGGWYLTFGKTDPGTLTYWKH